MEYQATILVNKEEAKEMEKILSITEGACTEYSYNAVIKTYSAKFSNGFESDIKVCNGDTPYVDPILFDENGFELVVSDVSDSLLGEYCFEFEGDNFTVNIEVEEIKNYIMVWIEEDEKWEYLTEELNPEHYPNGYGDYYIDVKNGVIINDTYSPLNKGKSFTDVYDIAKWEN